MKQNEEIARQLLYTLNAYNWAVNRYSNEKMEEIDIGHIIKVLSAKDQEYEGRIDNLEKELKARGYDVVEIAGAHLKGLVHPDEIQTMQRNQIKDLQAKIEDLEKELLGLRSYCTLTFGESHPEIKKCVHEVELEQLKNKEKRDG